jgi:hypothetical protein
LLQRLNVGFQGLDKRPLIGPFINPSRGPLVPLLRPPVVPLLRGVCQALGDLDEGALVIADSPGLTAANRPLTYGLDV